MEIKIHQAPNWAVAAAELVNTKSSILLYAATRMVLDCCFKIRSGLTLEGGAQKSNSKSWYDTKARRAITPNVPLVLSGDLSDVSKWRINGQPASQFMAGGAPRRVAAGGTIQFHRGYKTDYVTVRLPSNRDTIAHELELLGYRVPFGISPEVEAGVRLAGEMALGELAEAGHFLTGRQTGRIASRPGLSLDVSAPQAEFRAIFRTVP